MKIIWAVDPLAEDPGVLESVAAFIRALGQKVELWVQPVFLVGSYPLNLPDPRIREMQLELTREADRRMAELANRYQIQGLEPFLILSEPYTNLRQAADVMIQHSRDQEADMTLVASHSRKGIPRLFLGSFAETLLLRSDVPVLVIHPSVTPAQMQANAADLGHILFPTDFSDYSKEALKAALELAKKLGSRITLFHKLDYGFTPSLDLAFAAYPIYRTQAEEALESCAKTGKDWVAWIREQGVEVGLSIDENVLKSAAQAILEKSREMPSLIAMASESGPISSVLLGSTTRKVIRAATVPVWVVRPRLAQKAKAA